MAVEIGIQQIPFAAWGTKILYYLGYGLVLGAAGLILGLLWWYTGYQYKLNYWPVTGNINDGITVDKQKTNKVKWNKQKTAWKVMRPFGNKKEIEPFSPDNIYPGKNLYAFKLGETYIPAKLSLEQDKFSIKPIPYYIQNWQMMELKANEEEFKKKSLWEENKYFFMVIITAVACCAVVGITVYYTYQYAQNNLHETSSMLANAARTIKAPGA